MGFWLIVFVLFDWISLESAIGLYLIYLLFVKD